MLVKTLQDGALSAAGASTAIEIEASGGAKGTIQLVITTAEGLESFSLQVQGRLSDDQGWQNIPSASWTAAAGSAVLTDVVLYPQMRFNCSAFSGSASTLTVVAQIGY